MKLHAWLVLSLALLCPLVSFAQDVPQPNASSDNDSGVTVSGQIKRVTVYRDRALVSRDIPVPAQAVNVLTISGLPEQLIPGSVFAEGDESYEVRAVEVSSRPITNSDRQEVRNLELEIAELQTQVNRVQSQAQLNQTNMASLDQMVNFTAAKTSDDLNRGTLDANAVVELTNFALKTRSDLLTEQLELKEQSDKLQKELDEKTTQLSQLVAGDFRQAIDAKIYIDLKANAEGNPPAGTIKLNYLVDGCQWTPRYTIQGESSGNNFTIRYSALVQQISGEDWSNVALTLSTASPSVSAKGPQLTPFRISAVSSNQQVARNDYGNFSEDAKQLNERFNSLRAQQRSVENSLMEKGTNAAPAQRDLALNQLAGQIQELELAAEPNAATRIAADADDDVASQVYTLSQPVTLESRRQQQLVRIAELQLAGELYHVATPLLSSYAYRRAEMTNTDTIGLLGGQADVYLDDRFVGVTDIPTTASGQKLLIGFGADQQVRTRRELRSKNDTIRGGNRNLDFTYRLVIANFKNQPVNIRLYDRMPIASESRDVAVKLLPPEKPLSEDPLYERISKERGILRWDLEVPADSQGNNTMDIDYTYEIEFDRNQTLSTQEVAQTIQFDFFNDQQAMPFGMGGGMGGMGNAPAAPAPQN